MSLDQFATIDPRLLASSGVHGMAVLLGVVAVVRVIAQPRGDESRTSFHETDRRRQLRAGSTIYRLFEPMVDEIAAWNASRRATLCRNVGRGLVASADPLPWRSEEFLAVHQVKGLGVGLAVLLVMTQFSGWSVVAALLAGALSGFGVEWLSLRRLEARVDDRMRRIRKKLPYAVDLLTLLMQAGSSFQESLTVVVREMRGQEIAEPFGRALREIAMGHTRRDALENLRDALGTEEIAELVFAINEGEDLGIPLVQILKTQAHQMRLKRSQWIEKAASTAQVQIVFPGLISMLACLIIVMAPFLMYLLRDSSTGL
ncbi:MAG: type II secretion system F family protein [Isosphaeraceae bacterium]